MFKGPLFIVGMPRSGTKLLRDLLKQNDEIGISATETHFIPTVISKYSDPKMIKDDLSQFIDFFRRTSFYINEKENGNGQDLNRLRESIIYDDWNSFFRSLLHPFINKDYRIWGDKTPGYLRNISLLDSTFPNSKFIHIVRDPRDYALSMKNTWGKNIFLSASEWYSLVSKANEIGKTLGNRYLEIRYEDLLTNTEKEISKICEFLEVKYHSMMTKLENPTGKYDSTKDKTYVVKSNSGKYLNSMPPKSVKKIEQLVFPKIVELGYSTHHRLGENLELSTFEKRWYKILDLTNMTLYYIRQKGLFKGVRYYFKVGSENRRLKKYI